MILPIVVGVFQIGSGLPLLAAWFQFFATININVIIQYLFFSIFLYNVFIFGSARRKKRRKIANDDQKPNKSEQVTLQNKYISLNFTKKYTFNHCLLNAVYLLFVIFSLYYVYLLRGNIFRGYFGDYSLYLHTGTMSALFLTLFSLDKYLERNFKLFKLRDNMNIFRKTYLIFLGILLLSFGGRLYVMTVIVAVLVYRSKYVKKITVKQAGVLFAAGLTAFVAMGLLRFNQMVYFDGMASIFLAESLFVSFSMLAFLNAQNLPLLNFPIFLISYIPNLIPSVIFDSQNIWRNFSDYGYVHYSPGGALNVYVSLIVNFGIIGSIIAVYFFGRLLRYLEKHKGHKWQAVSYSLVTAFLLSSVFRDGFHVSLVKNIFQFSILLPIIFSIIIYSKKEVSNKNYYIKEKKIQYDIV